MKKIFTKGIALIMSGLIVMGSLYTAPVYAAAPEVGVGAELESMYGEWHGSGSYNAYYKAEGSDAYTKIDNALIRTDGSGGYRVQVLGLKGGVNYTVKVVPVSNGTENEAEAFTFSGTPSAYDRSGYAHFKTANNPGAYNLDGTLPANAKVIYVNDANKNSVELNGKKGLKNIINEYNNNRTGPLVIRFIGQVNASGLSGLDEQMMGLKGKDGLTIEGVGTDACLYGWGFNISGLEDLEIRNLTFSWYFEDAVGMQSAYHVWVHNNTFTVGHRDWPPSDADKTNGDGSCDAKRSDYVTVSYNHFKGTAKSILLGSSKNSREDTGHFTYHHNFFEGSEQRLPRVRWHDVHIYNNYYKDCGYALDTHYDEKAWENGNIIETAHKGDKIGYGIGATCNCSIFAENNYFENTYRPMLTSDKNCSALSANDGGVIKAFGNYYDDYSLSTMETKDRFEAPSKDHRLTASDYTCTLGGWTYDNFDTSSDFYTNDYFVESAQDCVDTVTKLAGVQKSTALTLTNAINGSETGTGDNTQPATETTTAEKPSETTTFSEVTTKDGETTTKSDGETESTTEPTTTDTLLSLSDDYYYEFGNTGSTDLSFGGANGSGTFFTADKTLNQSSTKGTVNVNGTPYTFNGVGGFANNSTIKFTAEKSGTLTIISTTGSTTQRKIVISDAAGSEIGFINSGASGEASATAISLAAGSYTITNKGGGEAKLFYIGYSNDKEQPKPEIVYGDADLNGTIEIDDAALVFQYTLNKAAVKTDSDFVVRCDVDLSTEIDSADAAAIFQKVLNGAFIMEAEK